MTEINQKIVDMIKQKKTIEEISNSLNLSYKQIYNRTSSLENQGYIAKRIYNSDGILTYTFGDDNCYHLNNSFELFNTQKKLKMLVISDLHIGNVYSDEEALDTIYNYCIKNGIHVIINCGDILDGTYTKTQYFIPPEEQIEYLIKNYPFDKSIFNLYINGDHDISLHQKNISLNSAIKRRRHDICPISNSKDLNSGIIAINNNRIMVSHKAPVLEEITLSNAKLHLVGHNHISKTVLQINESKNITPRIMVAPLARNSVPEQINIPRAIELTIYMDDKYKFRSVEKKDLLIINDKALNIGETIINYSKYKICALDPEEKKLTQKYVDYDSNVANKTFKDSEGNETDTLNVQQQMVDDDSHATNKIFKDSEIKETGVLNAQQQQMVDDFFKKTNSTKKLDKMIKDLKRKKKKWQ